MEEVMKLGYWTFYDLDGTIKTLSKRIEVYHRECDGKHTLTYDKFVVTGHSLQNAIWRLLTELSANGSPLIQEAKEFYKRRNTHRVD